jgi:hypothetical protein
MKYLIVLVMTAVSFGQIVPLKSESRPAGTASRPSKWVVTQAEKLAASVKGVDEVRHKMLALEMEKPGPLPAGKAYLNHKKIKTLDELIKSYERQEEVEKEITAGLTEGKDNDYGWVQVGVGVEIKMIPGWYRPQKTTRSELISNTDLDAQAMRRHEKDCYEAYIQPILIKVDATQVDAYKFTVVFFDKFNTPVVSPEIRRDEIKNNTEVVMLGLRANASRLNAAMADKKFDIPFEIASKEVVPKFAEMR